jgi:ferredoxin-NADP reductase
VSTPAPAPAAAAATAPAWRIAVVEQVLRRTPNAVSVFLRDPFGAHRAGQHVDVRLVAEDGYEARRSYSIASAPGAPRLELLVERLPDGEVSPYFNDVVRPGDTIELLGPIGGHFVWSAEQAGPLLLLAGGSGIAPLMAMLRERAAHAPAVDAMLVYSARTWAELAFADELLAMAERDPRLRFVAVTTRERARRAGDLDRRLDASALAGLLQAWAREPADVYVCGATGFVETVSSALVDGGLPARRISAERYGGT